MNLEEKILEHFQQMNSIERLKWSILKLRELKNQRIGIECRIAIEEKEV